MISRCTDALGLLQFQTPAVRHLAWLCQAPQLITGNTVFTPAMYLPEILPAILKSWDNNPGIRPEILDATPHYRLGHYVEALYACLMQDLLGWTILAKNLPIRDNGITLGELDFVVFNPLLHQVEHHEIAIKFYLGYPGCPERPTGWYGPNPHDRLDIKTARLLEQQSQRIHLPATKDVLTQLGIAVPETSRVFMPGYLFYPQRPNSNVAGVITSLSAPANVPGNHLRGEWLYLRDVVEADTRAWVPLHKPDWLGPWAQEETPDAIDTEQTLSAIGNTGTPRLFASLERDSCRDVWVETGRVFVVPDHWPSHN